jgi:hypothetical protein
MKRQGLRPAFFVSLCRPAESAPALFTEMAAALVAGNVRVL